jgi:predicted house-cleaning NTP pyrophosphatase (Maf/HAM1 superfamily)
MMAAVFFGLANRPALVTVEAARACVAKLIDPPVFLLGSQSASRRALLEATGASFETLVPDIDEAAIGDRARDAPASIVERIAVAKADALLERLRTGAHPPLRLALDSAILLTGDQARAAARACRVATSRARARAR